MCEFHDCNCNDLGDIWWTDKCMYFSSIDIKENIPAYYEVQLTEEEDCNEAIWCKLVTEHTTVNIGVVYRCPNIIKQNNEKT